MTPNTSFKITLLLKANIWKTVHFTDKTLWPGFQAAFFEIKYVKTVQDKATVNIEHK